MGPGILSAPAAFKPLQPFEMKPNFFQSNGSMFVNRMFWRGLRSRTVDDLKPGLRTFYMLVKRKQSSRPLEAQFDWHSQDHAQGNPA